MTNVHFDMADPSGRPLNGNIGLVPTMRLNVAGQVRLPTSVYVTLAEGEATVDLLPSTTQWCWRVSELVPGGVTRYIAVPESTETVEYANLDAIDPATLDVSTANVAAWELATRAAQDAVSRLDIVDSAVAQVEEYARQAQEALDESKRFDLTVGTVGSVDYGGHAAASVNGEWPNKTIDLTLVTGPTGPQGERGPGGPQGIQGEKGDPFSIAKVYDSKTSMDADYANPDIPQGSFVLIDTGSVEDPENATLWVKGSTAYQYLTDLSGATGVQGPQGIQGIQGLQGDQGIQGPSGTMEIGVVTTGEAGTQAAVTNTGTPEHAVWNITIPKGDKGEKGDQGDPGKDSVQLMTASTLEEALTLSQQNPDHLVLVLEDADAAA